MSKWPSKISDQGLLAVIGTKCVSTKYYCVNVKYLLLNTIQKVFDKSMTDHLSLEDLMLELFSLLPSYSLLSYLPPTMFMLVLLVSSPVEVYWSTKRQREQNRTADAAGWQPGEWQVKQSVCLYFEKGCPKGHMQSCGIWRMKASAILVR